PVELERGLFGPEDVDPFPRGDDDARTAGRRAPQRHPLEGDPGLPALERPCRRAPGSCAVEHGRVRRLHLTVTKTVELSGRLPAEPAIDQQRIRSRDVGRDRKDLQGQNECGRLRDTLEHSICNGKAHTTSKGPPGRALTARVSLMTLWFCSRARL